MGFLIDTNIGIAIERDRFSAADIHAVTRQAPIYLSPVNLAEIRFGIDLMVDAKRKHTGIHAPFSHICF
jgi:predicted nucleic acid-binding protein